VGAPGGTAMFSGATVISQSQSRQDSRETLATLAGDTGGVHFSTSVISARFSRACRMTLPAITWWAITARTRRGMAAAAHSREDRPTASRRASPHSRGLLRAEEFRRVHDRRPRAPVGRSVPLGPLPKSNCPWRSRPRSSAWTRIRCSFPSPQSSLPPRYSGRKSEAATRPRLILRRRCATRKTNRVAGALRDTITVKIDADHFQDMQQRALVYQGGIHTFAGEYKLKFLARENESGRIGTFEDSSRSRRHNPITCS